MAQKQFTNYQADILSFELREAMLGFLHPGRFGGFTTLVANGSSTGNIPVTIGHGTGVKKSTHASTPVLEEGFGIALSTQGILIHEDTDQDLTLTDGSSLSVGRYDILYMEHLYVDVVGDNPATYGIREGSDDNTIPTLSDDTIQIPLAYIKVPVGATTVSSLTYYPLQSMMRFGDWDTLSKLFGSTLPEIESTDNVGTVPSSGIIGNRGYTEQNYLTNYESLTDSLDALDIQVNDNEVDIAALNLRTLDSWALPSDTTSLNATETYHGLLPKLSGESTEFLNGEGDWEIPDKGFTWLGNSGAHFNTSSNLNDTAVQTLDARTEASLPTSATEIYVRVLMRKDGGSDSTRYGSLIFSRDSLSQDLFRCSMPFSPDNITVSGSSFELNFYGIIRLSTSGTFYMSMGSSSGSTADWNTHSSGNYNQIFILGYR